MYGVFDVLQIMLQRCRTARTLEQAVRQLLPAAMVRESLEVCGRPSGLLGDLAERFNLDSQALLKETAERLKLPCAAALHIPSTELIRQTGYEAQSLRAVSAIPQRTKSSAGWLLVVSDPADVSVEEFRRRGIRVSLASKEEIDATWEEFALLLKRRGQSELSERQLHAVLGRLVRDAKACGAAEVFLGHPQAASYEFAANGQRFTGKVHASLFRALMQRLADSSEGSFLILEDDQLRVEFAATKNFSTPVIYLNWRSRFNNEREIAPAAVKAAQTAAPALTRPTADDTSASSKKRILVLEDDAHFAGILTSVLARRGFETISFSKGEDALAAVWKSEPLPDLIISDIHMPGMDGAEFLVELRRTAASVPVLLLTSDEDVLLEAELVAKGANAFVRKQDDIRVLIAWCKNLTLCEWENAEEELVDAA